MSHESNQELGFRQAFEASLTKAGHQLVEKLLCGAQKHGRLDARALDLQLEVPPDVQLDQTMRWRPESRRKGMQMSGTMGR